MMILRSSPSSPFARKVRIATRLLGLDSKVEETPVALDDPADSLHAQNPLGKIPALVAEDGTCYYDSRVILEYLDHRAGGGRIVPHEPKARLDAMRLQALCDGILDACILQVYEGRYRPAEMKVASWLARQAGKAERGLAALEAAPPSLDGKTLPHVGQITLACVLGYRDLRFDPGWRKDHPRLHAWHDAFAAQVPAFAATKPEA